MKVSKLVGLLQDVLKEHGDIEVKFPAEVPAETDFDDSIGIEGLCTWLDVNDQPTYTMVYDKNTMVAVRGE